VHSSRYEVNGIYSGAQGTHGVVDISLENREGRCRKYKKVGKSAIVLWALNLSVLETKKISEHIKAKLYD
jgi:hypothetical protein